MVAFWAILNLWLTGCAGLAVEPEVIFKGGTEQKVWLGDIVSQVRPGGVVIMGEEHDVVAHHQHQRDFLTALAQKGAGINVGMEFFYYPDQPKVDRFLAGQISEADFLAEIKWGKNPFENYREQVLISIKTGGTTRALNAPQAISRKISQQGLASLSEEEKALLPPGFTLGNTLYKERFIELMTESHIPKDKAENYFAAQSLWDDTMAWQAAEFVKTHPHQYFVIIVGDFHAVYGGGLPDRLKARGVQDVTVVSQVNLLGLSENEQKDALAIHPKWGVRSDYVWTSAERLP